MEYAIAIFVGLWIAAAGLLSYVRIRRDFAPQPKSENDRKGDDAE